MQRNRTHEQVLVSQNKELFEAFLVCMRRKLDRKLFVDEIAQILGYKESSTTYRLIQQWGLYRHICKFRSLVEMEMCNLFPTEYVNVKNIIKGCELDLYYPEYNLAIEFNGLFWHSDHMKEQSYHYDKYLACKTAGIRLVQIV